MPGNNPLELMWHIFTSTGCCFNCFSIAPRGNGGEEEGGMIRNSLAGFYFYADDTLSSPGLSVLLALDFLAVFSELDQLFTSM